MSSGFARSGEWWDFELECEGPAGLNLEALARGVEGSTWIWRDAVLSGVFVRQGETLACVVGSAVMEVLDRAEGIKVVRVSDRPERMI